MAVPAGRKFGRYLYTDDAGNIFWIKLSKDMASAVGGVPAGAGIAKWGRLDGEDKVRHITGTTSDGSQRRSFPIPTLALLVSKYTGGTITLNSVVYNCTGRHGESVSRVPAGT